MTLKIIDIYEENYGKVDLSETPGLNFFHSANPSDVEYQREYQREYEVKTKFLVKLRVWLGPDSFGDISPPYI